MSLRHHVLLAPLFGIHETLFPPEPMGTLDDDVRCDGRLALVTGASSGLGFAVATELLRRGATVVAVARSADETVRTALCEAAGVPPSQVRALPLDLSDLQRVRGLPGELDRPLDLLIANAGMVSVGDDRTEHGLERMFVVNHVANHLLVRTLVERRALAPDARLIFVGSEAHRGAEAPDLQALAGHRPFGPTEALARYGTSKLLLVTLAMGLSRTLDRDVHALCPGAVDSAIARGAPRWVQPVMRWLFRLCFQSPEQAAAPVVWLALAPELAGRTGLYLHQGAQREPDPRTLDPAIQDAVHDATDALLDDLDGDQASASS